VEGPSAGATATGGGASRDAARVAAPLGLPHLLDDLMPRVLHCCWEDGWGARLGGVAAVRLLWRKLPAEYLTAWLPQLLRALMVVTRHLPEHSIPELTQINETLSGLIDKCYGPGSPGAAAVARYNDLLPAPPASPGAGDADETSPGDGKPSKGDGGSGDDGKSVGDKGAKGSGKWDKDKAKGAAAAANDGDDDDNGEAAGGSGAKDGAEKPKAAADESMDVDDGGKKGSEGGAAAVKSEGGASEGEAAAGSSEQDAAKKAAEKKPGGFLSGFGVCVCVSGFGV